MDTATVELGGKAVEFVWKSLLFLTSTTVQLILGEFISRVFSFVILTRFQLWHYQLSHEKICLNGACLNEVAIGAMCLQITE